MAITLDGTNGITTPSQTTNGDVIIADKIVHLDDTNTAIRFPAVDTFTVETAGSERLRIDSAGNLGIGITPSAFNAAYRAIQFQDGSIISPNNGSFAIVSNLYTDGAVTNRYVKNNFATYHDHYDGSYRWFTAPSGTAGNPITFTQAMTLDANGNLMVGTTSPGNSRLSISSTSTNTVNMSIINTNRTDQYLTLNMMGSNGFGVTGWADSGVIEAVALGNATGTKALYLSAYNGPMIFATNARNERMRIDSAGVVTIANLAGAGSRTVTAGATGILAAASDSRLKQEVPTAPIPGLAEIMKLEPRAYKWLDDIENRGEDASVEIGFFANEVKDVIPSAAPMGNDGYYGFYDRAVIAALTKAVQEQQVLITVLTARIEALENTQ